MIDLEQFGNLCIKTNSKIVMLVLDGLGGLPHPHTGKTELESAKTPNMDKLAENSICGLCHPISPGITAGSGPGHLALFGYNPLDFQIGRGILEAMGIDFPVTNNDVAARGNFCTVDNNGIITDRRAGRITTEKCIQLCKLLSSIKIKDVELFVLPVREHRFMLVMRDTNLSPDISDTDPQQTGKAALKCNARNSGAQFTADVINDFMGQAAYILKDRHPANMVLLRGFSGLPDIPTYDELFKLNALAIATYPMYRGLAKLVGMNICKPPADLDESISRLADNYAEYDYFFIHVKYTDSAGEDGDFPRKVAVIENVDSLLPRITELKPDVLMISGDHSTPAILKSHSWHPVPFLLYSKYCRKDGVKQFHEAACLSGGLGIFQSVDIMPLAMANALKLTKYGA
jgi:2,3-bisphosphoglycerate-independent phosphoglycerate mutase